MRERDVLGLITLSTPFQYRPVPTGVEFKFLLVSAVVFAFFFVFFFSGVVKIEELGIARLRPWTNSGNIRIFLAG